MEFIIGLLLGNAVVLIAGWLVFNTDFTNRKKVGITLTVGKRSHSRTLSWSQGFKVRAIPVPVLKGFRFSK